MKTLNIGILGLQGDIEEHQSALRRAYNKMGIEGSAACVRNASQIQNLHGLIIPGGESTAIGRLAQSEILEPANARIKKGLPVMGTCAGLIMLADKVYDKIVGGTKQPLLGGIDATVERNAFGRQRESFEAELTIPILGSEPYRGVFIRSPVVKEVGSKVKVLSQLNENIVAVEQGNIIGSCFHPELSQDTRLHEHFIKLVSQNPLLLSPGA